MPADSLAHECRHQPERHVDRDLDILVDGVTPTTHDLEQILDQTFPVWGEGLSREAYGKYNRAQCATPWGAANLRRCALVGDEPLTRRTTVQIDVRFNANRLSAGCPPLSRNPGSEFLNHNVRLPSVPIVL